MAGAARADLIVTRQLQSFTFAASLAALVGCSSTDAPANSPPFDADFTHCPVDAGTESSTSEAAADSSAEPEAEAFACTVSFACNAIEGALHQPICSPLTYGTNPPSSGNHYPIWAAYKTYAAPFLPGFWVHDLEHGAVVLTYNCPGGCADDVVRIQAFIDKLPADCGTPPRRIVLLPDPDLDVRFAASAWGYTLKAACFEEASFGAFVAAHYGQGLEDICSDGVDPLTAGAGGTPLCP